MKILKKIIGFTLMINLFLITYGQDQTSVKVIKLTEKLYKIEFFDQFDANIIASIGEDGLLLVDTGFKSTAKKLKEELLKLGNDKPVYIISSHEHRDHVGGNFIFGKEPITIGHKNLRTRMQTDGYILDEFPEDALPEITFSDSLTLHFNGEDIRIISIEGAHTDNDIMVHFTKSGYAYLGDDAYGMNIPSLDVRSGNDSLYAKCVKKALDLLPENTKFVSGHGRDLNMTEMREWQKMLEETIEVVRQEMGKGKDVVTMQNEKILKKWEKYVKPGYTTLNAWIQWVYNGFKGIKWDRKPLKAEYYRAYQKGGIESVKEIYYKLKKDKSGDYNINPYGLYQFASFLLGKDKIDEALNFFKFAISEYPAPYYFYDGLGALYLKKGDIGEAIKFYKKSLEIEPLNDNAIMVLKQIKKSKE